MRVEETEEEWTISAGECSFVFDKDSAQLKKGLYKGQTLLQGGPQLVMTGAELGKWKKTDNGISVSCDSWCYPDLGWGNDGGRPIYVGRGTYGDAVMRMQDAG